ncbi:hypothetical protein C3L29_040400, partial [Pseudomonas sp. MWU12-2534b]
MDRFDRKILAALHENARISFAELARRAAPGSTLSTFT